MYERIASSWDIVDVGDRRRMGSLEKSVVGFSLGHDLYNISHDQGRVEWERARAGPGPFAQRGKYWSDNVGTFILGGTVIFSEV